MSDEMPEDAMEVIVRYEQDAFKRNPKTNQPCRPPITLVAFCTPETLGEVEGSLKALERSRGWLGHYETKEMF